MTTLFDYMADHERDYRRGARHSAQAELTLDIQMYLKVYDREVSAKRASVVHEGTRYKETLADVHRRIDKSILDATAMQSGLPQYTRQHA